MAKLREMSVEKRRAYYRDAARRHRRRLGMRERGTWTSLRQLPPEELRAYMAKAGRRHYAKHRERILETQRGHYALNIEDKREYYRWYQQGRRGQRPNGRNHAMTFVQWKELVEVYGGRCAYCANEAKPTIEHIEPVSRGGTHTIDNIVPACEQCNKSKNAKPLILWLHRQNQFHRAA